MPSQVQIRALSVEIPVSFHRLIYRKIRSDLQEGSSALLQPQVTSIIHVPTHVGCGERFLLLTEPTGHTEEDPIRALAPLVNNSEVGHRWGIISHAASSPNTRSVLIAKQAYLRRLEPGQLQGLASSP